MTEKFDLSFFAGKFDKPETFKGDSNVYVVIGKLGKEKLGLQLEVGAGAVPYKGNPTKAIGFGFRLISIGQSKKLGEVFGNRGGSVFKAEDGEKHAGYRLVKTFVPLCNAGLSATQIHELAGVHLPELAEFVRGKLVAAGGEITLKDDQYLIVFKNCLESIDTSVLDLFHLPGVKPDWLDAPTPTKEDGPQEDDPCDGTE